MRKLIWVLAVAWAGAALALWAQQSGITGTVSKGVAKPRIAVPDFRGNDVAPNLMGAFNQTLWSDLDGSGRLTLVPKTMYPRMVPQQPSDFRQPPPPAPLERRKRKGQGMLVPETGGGLWMSDWSSPPASANYLAFGYTAMQNGVLVLYGNLFDMSRPDPNPSSQPISKRYIATTADENGAREVAHEFAADILKIFGAESLFGTHIFYVHQATFRSSKEIWEMDPDGKNQHQITHFNSTSIEPSVSPDGTKIAFTSYARGNPGIFVFSVNPVRDLRFYNQVASVNETPSFTPDGKQIVYSSSAGGCCRIYIAGLDGAGFRPLTASRFIDVEPKVNPKTGATVLFVSGRSGPQQIYMMTIDGADITRMTDGTGEASNPSWNPSGDSFAFSWTRGFAAGKFNIFIMDPASHQYVQLTHDEGRNENPSWAPDGAHLAFMSNRIGGRSQIFAMLADGTQLQQLTNNGLNYSPAWGSRRSFEEAEFMLSKRRISGIALAVTMVLFAAGCKKKAPAPPPPPPPAPAPAPAPPPAAPSIVSFSAEPSTIQRGQSSTLRWEVTGNVTSVSINEGIGTVQSNGSSRVSPSDSTTYTLTATGPGGNTNSNATVTVVSPPPPPPPPPPAAPTKTLEERVSELQDAYYDYDKSEIRSDAQTALTSDATALKSILADFPSATVTLEGNCDERGSAEYNIGLGDRRASSAKDFLVQLGVSADHLKTISFGKERPVCTEHDESCWQRNRRVHFSTGQ